MTYPYLALVIRILLGLIMLNHGWPKLADLKNASKGFKKNGFNPPVFWAAVFGVNELFGGFFMITGFYAELVAVLFGFEMLIISFWKIIAKESFLSYSYELQLLLLSWLITIFGSGEYALISSSGAGAFLEWPILPLVIVVAGLIAYQNQPVQRVKPASRSSENS